MPWYLVGGAILVAYAIVAFYVGRFCAINRRMEKAIDRPLQLSVTFQKRIVPKRPAQPVDHEKTGHLSVVGH